jgi:Protein of unknown function (DUF2874).
MKLKHLIIMIAALTAFSFAGCNDETVEHPASKYKDALADKYPNATNIVWERENPYMVAEFTDNGQYMWAYFNHKADWEWTQYEISFANVPAAVQTAYNNSEYATFQIYSILCITTPSTTYYQFELVSIPLNVIIYINSNGDFI